MNELNFKSFFNFIGRNKLYAFINLFGLSLSLAFVILIGCYTYRQLSTDSFQEKADRIYLLSTESTSGTSYYMQKFLLGRYPEIEKTTALLKHYTQAVVDTKTANVNMFFADSTFFDIFSFRLLDGDKNSALAVKNGAVISKTFAAGMFGDTDPIGKTLALSLDVDYKLVVTGIMEDIDNSAIPYADVIVAGASLPHFFPWQNERMESTGSCYTFVLTKAGADLHAKVPEIKEYLKEVYWVLGSGLQNEVVLTPLRKLYFNAIKDSDGHHLNSGNWSFVMILFAIGMILLIFSVINYVNLTMAQTSFRAREMATRRLLGTQRGMIIAKLIAESTMVCLVAYMFALCIAEVLSPAVSRLLAYDFSVFENFNTLKVVISVALVLVLGLLAGIIPALSISRFKPVDVMRGTFGTNNKMLWSKVLIVIQNVVTVTFLACALTMVLQVRHLINQPLGYNTKDIYMIDNQSVFHNQTTINAFRSELLRQPAVEEVGTGGGSPLDGTLNRTGPFEGSMLSAQFVMGDSAYFKIFGFELLEDYHLSVEEGVSAYYATESTTKRVNVNVEKPYMKLGDDTWSETMYILGTVRDFHVGKALMDTPPTFLELHTDPNQWTGRTTVIKINGDHDEALRQIEAAYNKVMPGGKFDGQGYLEDHIKAQYAEQSRMLRIVTVFTIAAILISALGLFAIAVYDTRKQRGDIAVRKVFGSTIPEELNRTVTGFMKWVFIGGLVACPLIYVIAERWLSTFNYRITMSWWIFGAAILFSLFVAFVTIFWQSIKAANTDPSESLRG